MLQTAPPSVSQANLNQRISRKASHLLWNVRLAGLRLLNSGRANRTEARRIYENEVLFSVHWALAPQRVLSVGVAAYTSFYEQVFSGSRYETIDIDPANAQWGSKQRHYVADLADFPLPAAGGPFNVVLFNGVYGWGVNSADQLTAALHMITKLLSDDGALVFGWNCVPSKDPLLLGSDLGSWFAAYEPRTVNGTHVIHAERSFGQRFMYFRKKAEPAPSKRT